MTAGSPPKPPAGKPTPVSPAAKPTPATPVVKPQAAVTPKAAPVAAAVRPVDALSREEIRGIAQAIARSESGNLRDELTGRLARLEERIGALEKRPITPAPAPVAAVAPVVAPVAAPVAAIAPVPVAVAAIAPAPAAVAAIAPAPAAAPAPVVAVSALAPLIHVPIAVDDTDLPFVSGARRRKRLAIVLVLLLLVSVGTIVVAAAVSQAINNHS